MNIDIIASDYNCDIRYVVFFTVVYPRRSSFVVFGVVVQRGEIISGKFMKLVYFSVGDLVIR